MALLNDIGNPTPRRINAKTAANLVVPQRKKLADVGNTIHQSMKNFPTSVKPGEINNPASCRNLSIPSNDTVRSETRYSSADLETKVTGNLNPRYFYEDEDDHDNCPGELFYDEIDNPLLLSIRLDSEDLKYLSGFKPSKTIWEHHWDVEVDQDIPDSLDYSSDLDDFNFFLPSPDDKKMSDHSLPFIEFTAPSIDLDFSF